MQNNMKDITPKKWAKLKFTATILYKISKFIFLVSLTLLFAIIYLVCLVVGGGRGGTSGSGNNAANGAYNQPWNQ